MEKQADEVRLAGELLEDLKSMYAEHRKGIHHDKEVPRPSGSDEGESE